MGDPNLELPEDLDGISMLPTLLGEEQEETHDALYWEFFERGFQQAVRTNDWKGTRLEEGGALELYNLSEDLGETNNIAANHPDLTLIAYPVISEKLKNEPWWASLDTARFLFAEYVKYLFALARFHIDAADLAE